MRQVIGGQLGDFAAIYEEDVELVSVTRPQALACDTQWKRLIQSRRIPELRWVQSADDRETPGYELPKTIEDDERTALVDQIVEGSEMLGELMDCDRIGVRIETLHAPMCPRFHVDHVTCRMLITLSGVGTEFIPNKDVDWAVLDNLDTDELPLQTEGQVQQLPTAHWSLLKGGAWHNWFRGVVHRSPHDVGERLLLSFDPVF